MIYNILKIYTYIITSIHSSLTTDRMIVLIQYMTQYPHSHESSCLLH